MKRKKSRITFSIIIDLVGSKKLEWANVYFTPDPSHVCVCVCAPPRTFKHTEIQAYLRGRRKRRRRRRRRRKRRKRRRIKRRRKRRRKRKRKRRKRRRRRRRRRKRKWSECQRCQVVLQKSGASGQSFPTPTKMPELSAFFVCLFTHTLFSASAA